MNRFDWFFDCLMELEGGYNDDPDDSGGETKFGIAKKYYPEEDIKNLTLERAKEIYKKDYYDRCKIDKIKDEALAFLVFQMSVVSGYTGAKLLQEMIGCTMDGVIGPKTLSKTNNYLPQEYADACMDHFKDIVKRNPSKSKFLAGWLSRIKRSKEFFNVP